MLKFLNATNSLTAAAIVLLFCATVLSFLGGFYWRFDYLAHGRVQLCALTAVLFLLTLLTLPTRPIAGRFIALSAIALGLNLYPILGFYLDRPARISSGENSTAFRAMAMNVNVANRHYAKAIREIRRENPDVLLVMEVNNDWMTQLSAIEGVYSYKVAAPQQNGFGMTLYSKSAFVSGKIGYWGQYQIPYIVALLKDPTGNTVRFFGIHTVPPISQAAATSNHRQSRYLMERARDENGPIVMMGDWNDTPWSHSYRALMNGFDFDNAAQGGFPTATWRPGFFGGIAIGHFFVKNMRAGNWHVGRDVGSDHRAVIADLQIFN